MTFSSTKYLVCSMKLELSTKMSIENPSYTKYRTVGYERTFSGTIC